MNSLITNARAHWFGIAIFLLLIVATFLRFYNYENRWGLASDQAHDAILAKYALENYKIPLVGPFSSAGPFQTGGQWYWIIMAAYAIYPYSVLTPWIVMTIISLAFVYGLILLGKHLLGKGFGIMLGVLASVSTAQLAQSVNLTNQTPLALASLLAIWSAVKYIEKKEGKYMFLLALATGIALTIHLQGILLILLILASLLFARPGKLSTLIFLFLGFSLPLVPLFIFDIQNNFINSRGFFQYILHEQYKVSLDVLGRRWLTYAGIFWPEAWAHVIGGAKILGYVEIIGLIAGVIYGLYTKAVSKPWLALIVAFGLTIVLLRYTRTPLFDSYIVFLHPFILLLTGWMIWVAYRIKAQLGLGLFLAIFIASIWKDIPQIRSGENTTFVQVTVWKDVLTSKFPDKKFVLYDYKYKYGNKSLPLVLVLYHDKKINDSGIKIGLTIDVTSPEDEQVTIYGKLGEYRLVDLSHMDDMQVARHNWGPVNPSQIYRSTQQWYKDKGERD